MSDFSEVSLLVAFTDFTRFAAQTERLDDVEVSRVMDAYPHRAGRTVRR